MNFDMDELRFKQGALLAIVPGLSVSTFQSWVARGLFPLAETRKHKNARLYVNATAIIGTYIVLQLTRYGIKPSLGFPIAERLVEELGVFFERFKPEERPEGYFEFPFEFSRAAEYRRFYVYAIDDEPGFKVLPEPSSLQRAVSAHGISICFELDLLFGELLTATSRFVAGLSPRGEIGSKIEEAE